MDFGVVLQTNPPAWRTVGLAKQAEEHGFDYVWTFDSHLLWQEPYVVYSAILAATRRIVVGPMVTNPATRDWTVTASVFATLNEMYGNRTVVGIGRGDSAVRVTNGKPTTLAELRESIHVIRELGNSRSVEYNGAELRFPWSVGSELEVWVAAYGPLALKLTGEVGDGFILQLADIDIAKEPMEVFPTVHYTMGGLWVDYDLQSTIPGMFVIGEANFSDHGANRLGASALMQGLADGYFVLPSTISSYLADGPFDKVADDHPAAVEALQGVQQQTQKLLSINGTRTPASFHRELGQLMWDLCGMERSEDGLLKAIDLIRGLREEFWRNVRVLGAADTLNQSLEKAGRVADFLELGELMCIDALHRRESCGGHFRAESQTEDGEALRHDDQYAYVAAWEWAGEQDGDMETPVLHKEQLTYEFVEMKQRSYK